MSIRGIVTWAGVAAFWFLGVGAVAEGTVVYVAKSGSDVNDGLSWSTAKVTVQAGLNAALSGDQVWVAAGTYVECVTLQAEVGLYGGFAGSETDLSQRDWKANLTILDGNQAGSVVTAPSGSTAATRIDGFTIRNGKATAGGGIYCKSSSLTILNNTITENSAARDSSCRGGGLYCSGGSPTISSNTIVGNTASSGGGICCDSSSPVISNNTVTGNTAFAAGGGINCNYSASPTISRNTITANKANSGGGVYCNSSSPTIANNTITGNTASSVGGGICCYASSSPTISKNTITGNIAAGNYGGGGISCSGSSPTISNNTITGNIATGSGSSSGGGGIFCISSSSPTISNNTITGNVTAGAYGGGGLCFYGGSPTISNNTIIGNSASSGGGIRCLSSSPAITNTIVGFNSSGVRSSGSSTLSLRSNCVYGNTAYNYSGVTDPTGSNGNVSVDPQLVAADYGEVHLTAGSPCMDAGDDTVVQSGWVDLDSEPRIQGTRVDIGADEFNGTTPSFAPRIVRVSASGNDSNDGSSWELAKRTVQAGIDTVTSAGGGDVWVAAGTYTEQITLKLLFHVYGGFAGTETRRDQRDWITHVTILDGNASGSVVSVSYGNSISTVDGFTIRNGKASSGGGICCSFSSPTIANNTVTGNCASALGGGIYCSGGSPTISNNTITGNCGPETATFGICRGSGVCCPSSSPTISNNTITGNSATGSALYGGGIYCSGDSATISNNTITGNTLTGNYSGGGGIYCESSFSTISNNTITGNSATGSGSTNSGGGGIWCGSGSPTISNNTVTGNAASYGGGIFSSSSTTITNTIVAFNSSGIEGPSTLNLLRNNCVYGNAAYNYSGVPDATGTNGNISVDPQLLAVDYGALHLKVGSPCIDAGDDAVVQAGCVDMDGEPRIQGAHVDIGADEFNGTPPSFTPRIVRVSPSGNDSNDGSSWELTKQTVQAGINATAIAGGGEVWVAAGTYTERIALGVFFHVYGGFAGTETHRNQRNWATHVTILDGNAGGSVVSMSYGSDMSTLDGFTIRNGKVPSSASGGGIYCISSSPSIANNTITGNSAGYNAGGIYCKVSSPTISNNTITGNSASGLGGGIYCESSSPTISNNTIASNRAAYGGGVFSRSSSPTLTNNIVAFNSSGFYRDSTSSAAPTLRYNCVYGNNFVNYYGVPEPAGTDGNISADPSFVRTPKAGADKQWATADDDLGDLHLKAGSPCIDAGDNAAVPAGVLTDLDGLARFFDDPTTPDTGLGTAPIVDMGAYEYVPGDFDHDGDIDAEDLKAFATCVSGPAVPYSSDCAGADFDRDGDVDQSDFGLLQRWFGGV